MDKIKERDYQKKVSSIGPTTFIPGTSIEIVREPLTRHQPKGALFDFDGTLSLIREGWQGVMISMMVEILQNKGAPETKVELEKIVRTFIDDLTGKQTIYQMIRFSEELIKRGIKTEKPEVYKELYNNKLMQKIQSRREGLSLGELKPDDYLVPSTINFLNALTDLGIKMYLASGTDKEYVLAEVALLGLDCYFGQHIYGAPLSKQMVVDNIIREENISGAELVGFGDGFVEIDCVKSVGGIAVAVASDENGRSGKPERWKRERLIGAGADLVVPDYQNYIELAEYIFAGKKKL